MIFYLFVVYKLIDSDYTYSTVCKSELPALNQKHLDTDSIVTILLLY